MSKVRFRLRFSKRQWVLYRSSSKKAKAPDDPDLGWALDSYHPSIKSALRYLLDRLVAEGHEPGGVASLLERMEQAELRVMEFGEKLDGNQDAEVESL